MRSFRFSALLKTAVILGILLCITITAGSTAARADNEGAATVTASALNMRSEPNTSSSVVTCLPKGTVVLVTGSSDGWYQVSYKGNTGYMSGDYLSFTTEAKADFGTGSVKGTTVNVRSGPGTGYSVLGTVNSGDSFSVTGVSGGWYKIDYKGAEAYVNADYMTVGSSASGADTSSGKTETPSTAAVSQGTGVINGTYVRLRSGPSTGYSILGTYNTGTKMTVTGTSGDWYAVTYNGTKGYVYKQYLTLGDSGSESSSTGGSGNGSFTVEAMTDTPAATTTAVHMRSGPDTSYASQRVLSSGASVTITGKSGKWYRVSYNGSTGYIHSDYVKTGSAQQAASPSSGSGGDKIVAYAKQFLGTRYVYGGTSPSGFDCSGFVYYVYRQNGYSITRVVSSQNRDGVAVSRSNLQPGDILIFNNSANTSFGHSGIYIGNNQFIHASSGSGKVIISSLSESYYNARYVGARRIV